MQIVGHEEADARVWKHSILAIDPAPIFHAFALGRLEQEQQIAESARYVAAVDLIQYH